MGTNYYAIKIPTLKEKKHFIKLADLNKWGELRNELPQEIHIGKSSAGWKFCFDHNNWEYWGKTTESLKAFLDTCVLYDEYGRDCTHDDFWALVDRKKDASIDFNYSTNIDGLRYSESTGFS